MYSPETGLIYPSGLTPQAQYKAPIEDVLSQAGLVGLWDFFPERTTYAGGNTTVKNRVAGGIDLIGATPASIVESYNNKCPPNGVPYVGTFNGTTMIKAASLLPVVNDYGFSLLIVYRAALALGPATGNTFLAANGSGTSNVRSLICSTGGLMYGRIGTTGSYYDLSDRFSVGGYTYVFWQFFNAAVTGNRQSKMLMMGNSQVNGVLGTTQSWSASDLCVGARSDATAGFKGQIARVAAWYGAGTNGLILDRATDLIAAVAMARETCGMYDAWRGL